MIDMTREMRTYTAVASQNLCRNLTTDVGAVSPVTRSCDRSCAWLGVRDPIGVSQPGASQMSSLSRQCARVNPGQGDTDARPRSVVPAARQPPGQSAQREHAA